jgi:hypothetical protein
MKSKELIMHDSLTLTQAYIDHKLCAKTKSSEKQVRVHMFAKTKSNKNNCHKFRYKIDKTQIRRSFKLGH